MKTTHSFVLPLGSCGLAASNLFRQKRGAENGRWRRSSPNRPAGPCGAIAVIDISAF